MEMNRATLQEFRKDFQEHVKGLEEKYGVTIQMGNITYGETDFHFKTEVKNKVSSEEAERQQKDDFDRYCRLYGFDSSDYRKQFQYGNSTYEFIGFEPKKRKYPCLCKEVTGEKMLVFTVESLSELLGK